MTQLRLSAALCATGVLLLPLAARSSRSLLGPGRAPQVPAAIALPGAPATHAPLVIGKDPFAPPPGAIAGGRPGAVVVQAIVSGAHAAAIVAVDGRGHVVRRGDAILGTRVVEIGSRGVALADGRFIRMTGAPR